MKMDEFAGYLQLRNNCDPDDPLLSSTPLGKRLESILLCHLDRKSLNSLTEALNVEQLITTQVGHARDYRGLAELMGFNAIKIDNLCKRAENPTRTLIDAFIIKNLNSTLNDLLKMIEIIERFDVIDDFLPTLIDLASSINISAQNLNNHTVCVARAPQEQSSISRSDNFVSEDVQKLTIDDRSNFLARYDAFICYAPEDIDHALCMISILESKSKRVATAQDLLPGHFEYDSLSRLIDERCSKVIIILTPNFSRSKECEFQTKFANEVGLKSDCRKIIPVVFEPCDDTKLPSMIKVLTKIDMTNYGRGGGRHDWNVGRIMRCLDTDDESRSSMNNISKLNLYQNDGPKMAIQNDFQPTAMRAQSYQSDVLRLGEPIVYLVQSSSTIEPSETDIKSFDLRQSIEQNQDLNSTTSMKMRPFRWLKVLTKKVVGGAADVTPSDHSTSSRAMLISPGSPDLSIDKASLYRT